MKKPHGVIMEWTPDQYLADPCMTPSLSASVATAMVLESPLHAWTMHPRLGGLKHASTPAMDDGSILHKLILGKGKDVEVVDVEAFRTKASRETRDAAIAAGRIPCKREKYLQMVEIAAKLQDKCLALGIKFDGASEVPIEFMQETSGRKVLCRAMLDHVWVDRAHIIDVKKVKSANPRYLQRNFVEYGYPIQWRAYSAALAAVEPEFEGHVDFLFLFMEIEPPYSVVPVRPDGAFREIGRLQWAEALHRWRECLDKGYWPGYCEGAITLAAPVWDINRYIGNEEAA